MNLIPILLAAMNTTQAFPLNLVPYPKTVSPNNGSFQLTQVRGVGLEADEDKFAASQIVGELKAAGFASVKLAGKGEIQLVRISPKDDQGSKFGEYTLQVTPTGVQIQADTDEGIFYGVQTLRQLIRANRQDGAIPAMSIRDWATLRFRGWQDDISRGPIPTMEYIKLQIERMSALKLNCMTLYTEHVFKLKGHPTIAPESGLTAEEVRELDAYAKKHHITLIGNFQSFGHFANILNKPGYGHLGEAGWVISPAKEESYQFLKEVFAEVAPAYSSPLFNINCDETGGLGQGASKEMVEKEGLAAVYARHISRVADLLRPHGKRVMMWGDIASQHRDIVPRLPKDLIALPWGYHAGESFLGMIRPFTEMSLEFLVCPGVSCWNQIYPDMDNAATNIAHFVRDGAALNTLGVINTSWDDSGENLFDATWIPFAWGAENAWTPVPPDQKRDDWAPKREAFQRAIGPVFMGEAGSDFGDLTLRLSRLRQNPITNGMADSAFWWTIQRVPADRRQPSDVLAALRETREILEGLQSLKERAGTGGWGIDAAIHAAQRVRFTAFRADAAQTLAELADSPDKGNEFGDKTRRLVKELEELREDYIRLWNAENRPWWLDQNLAKFDELANQIGAMADRPIILPMARTFQEQTDVVIVSPIKGAVVRYTLDGTEPGPNSPVASRPINIGEPTTVRAKIDGSLVEVQARFRTTTFPATVRSNLTPHEDHDLYRILDGEADSFFWSSGSPGLDSHITIDFARPLTVKGVSVTTGHSSRPGDRIVGGVLEARSGRRWQKVADFVEGRAEAELDGSPIEGLRIRVTQESGMWLIVQEVAIRQ